MAEGQGMNGNDENDGQSPNSSNNSGLNGEVSLDLMVDAYAQEYQNLDQTMDEIDSWMTKLEQQNDSLYAQLDDLLESSRQTRKELQEQSESTSENGTVMDCTENKAENAKEIPEDVKVESATGVVKHNPDDMETTDKCLTKDEENER